MEPPKVVRAVAVSDWKEFLQNTPLREDFRSLGFVLGFHMAPLNNRLLIKDLRSLCDADIRRFNEKYGTTYEKWKSVAVGVERWPDRNFSPTSPPLGPLYRQFRAKRPAYQFYAVSLDGDFLERQIYPRFGKFKIERSEER